MYFSTVLDTVLHNSAALLILYQPHQHCSTVSKERTFRGKSCRRHDDVVHLLPDVWGPRVSFDGIRNALHQNF